MNEIQRKFLEKAQKSLTVARQINETGYTEFLDIDISYDEAHQVIQQAEEMLSFAFDNL